MSVRVHLAAGLRDLSGGVADVDVEAGTVRALIRRLDEMFPGMADRLEGASVAIDGVILADAVYEDVPDEAEVHFLPTLGGG